VEQLAVPNALPSFIESSSFNMEYHIVIMYIQYNERTSTLKNWKPIPTFIARGLCTYLYDNKSTYNSDSIPVPIQSSIVERRESFVISLNSFCRVAEQVSNTAIDKKNIIMKNSCLSVKLRVYFASLSLELA